MAARPDRTLRALNRATLARQGLLERRPSGPEEIAERVCGLQAQEPLPPLIGLWSRGADARREALEELMRAGALVRGTLMRGTLHLVTPRDFRRLRPAIAPVLEAALAGHPYTRDLDLDAAEAAARGILESEGPMTFAELRPRLAEARPGEHERGLGYAARLRLPLVVGADGRFALEKTGRALPRGKLVERYLAAFGPAAPADFSAWSGLRGAAEAFAAAGLEEHAGLPDIAGGERPDPDVPAPPRLLPAFDNLVLAHKDRARVLHPADQGRVTTKNLRVHPTFLVDGWVAGTWKLERKGKRASVALAPFGRVAKAARAALEEEAAGLLAFAEPDASATGVTWNP